MPLPPISLSKTDHQLVDDLGWGENPNLCTDPAAAWWWNQLLSFQSVVSSHRERNRCRPDQAVIMLEIPGSLLSPSLWSGKVTQRDDPQRQQVGAVSYSSKQNTNHDNWSVTCICLPMTCPLQSSAQQQSSHFLEGGYAIKDNQGTLPVPNSFILISSKR